MKDIELKPYLLLHITTKKNLKLIKKDNGFIESKHDLESNKNQWLGDGIYFWDGNDDKVIAFGKIVIGRKKGNIGKRLVGIYVNVDIEPDRHLNLEDNKNLNDFFEFIRESNPDNGEEVINVIKILRKRESVDKDISSEVGKFLGININLYLKHLQENCGKTIDMVSCYFFSRKIELFPFSRGEQVFRQFCIKRADIINNNINNWKVSNRI